MLVGYKSYVDIEMAVGDPQFLRFKDFTFLTIENDDEYERLKKVVNYYENHISGRRDCGAYER